MIRITASGDVNMLGSHACHYKLAGQAIVCQREIPALAAFSGGYASERFSELISNFKEPELLTAANSTLHYFGTAPFANQSRDVRFWRTSERAQIDIDGHPACQIDFGEAHIHVVNGEALDSKINLELITGPALVLLLAQSQTYCLHAGSVQTPSGRFAIIAESGVGKSTLSKHVDTNWHQISDDILPVRVVDKRVELIPEFPQLKLSNSTVANPTSGVQFLDGVIRIKPKPREHILFNKLSKADGMLQIVRHTVAAKLFDNDILEEHVSFAKSVSAAVPVVEVRYPRDLKSLSQLRVAISNYMGELLDGAH